MESAGITGASVHTLRHTFATHTVQKGTNLRVVEEAPGHPSLQVPECHDIMPSCCIMPAMSKYRRSSAISP